MKDLRDSPDVASPCEPRSAGAGRRRPVPDWPCPVTSSRILFRQLSRRTEGRALPLPPDAERRTDPFVRRHFMPGSVFFKAAGPIGGTDINALPVKEIGPAVGYYTQCLGFALIS